MKRICKQCGEQITKPKNKLFCDITCSNRYKAKEFTAKFGYTRSQLKDRLTKEEFAHYQRARRYSMTPVELTAMLDANDGLCDLCREVPHEVVDHCHSTGKVRGLLCHPCNKGLGNFSDSLEKLEAAKTYLIAQASIAEMD